MATATLVRPKADTTTAPAVAILDKLQEAGQDAPHSRAQRLKLEHPYAVAYAKFLLGVTVKQPSPSVYRITKPKAKSLREAVRSSTPDLRRKAGGGAKVTRPQTPKTGRGRGTVSPKRTPGERTTREKVSEAVAAKPSVYTTDDARIIAEGLALVIEQREAELATAQANLDAAKALARKVLA